MARLVALALPGGPAYVDAIRRVWDASDAIAPIDDRLPSAEQERVLSVLAPEEIIEADGERRSLNGGQPIEPGDALVIATSGTGGEQKAVIHTHDSVAASAWATSEALGVDPANDSWLACLPLAHVGGLSVVLRSLVTATPVEVHATFDASAVVDSADRGATLTSLVTRALAQVPAERFRAILLGGAAPPPERPGNVIATYGMTETGSGIVYDRRPLDGVELRVDADGELHVRGPMLFRAYRHDLEPLVDGWFATGDLATWDGDTLQVEGRRGDVIVTGGEKVWPGPIETLLATHPAIADVALAARPDPEWGQRVIALVVASDPAAPPPLDELRSLVGAEFGPWCAPRELVVVDRLPRTALGKIKRAALAPLATGAATLR